jgi:hypothetical protein
MTSHVRILIGSWEKEPGGECDRHYPDFLEFSQATYRGTKGEGQDFIVWDAGTWQMEGPDQVRISTASDELVVYQVTATDDVLTFRDPEGCQFSYRRLHP